MANLKEEFERMRPMLLEQGKNRDHVGAFARAMLEFVPIFIVHLDRCNKANIPARDVFNGLADLYSNLIYQTLQTLIEPQDRAAALELMLRHIGQGVAPKLIQTSGGILLPHGQFTRQ